MATFCLTNPYCMIAATAVTEYVKSVEVTYSKEIKDTTYSGCTGKARGAGLADWSIKITFNQDYAAGKIDALMHAAVGVSTAIKIRPIDTTIAATNPEYRGNGLLAEYSPIAGAVGDWAETSVTFECADGVALIRSESA